MRLLAIACSVLLLGCSREPAVSVQVRAWADPEQGVWEFQYPGPDGVWDTADDRGSTNRAILPAGRDVTLQIESAGPPATICISDLGSSELSPTSFQIPSSALREKEKLEFWCGEYVGMKTTEMRGSISVLDSSDFDLQLSKLSPW